MVATNIINNVLEVELDEYLYAYRLTICCLYRGSSLRM